MVTRSIEMSIDDLFVNDEDSEYESNVYKQLKELIDIDSDEADKKIQEINEELRIELDVIAKRGNTIIPQTSLSKIIKNNGRIPETVARKVKKRGVLIVRHTIPTETIHQWMADLGCISSLQNPAMSYYLNDFEYRTHANNRLAFYSKTMVFALILAHYKRI